MFLPELLTEMPGVGAVHLAPLLVEGRHHDAQFVVICQEGHASPGPESWRPNGAVFPGNSSNN